MTFKVHDQPQIGIPHLRVDERLPERPADMLEVEIIQRIIALEKIVADQHKEMLMVLSSIATAIYEKPIRVPWYRRLWAYLRRPL